jgi:hypothetical protein
MTLSRLFEQWPRKILSLFLAALIWVVANHSMTTTKIFNNVPVRVLNLPEGKTVDDLQLNGMLNKRVILTLTGNERALNELTSKELEVLIDAHDTPEQWIATVTKKNLLCLNQNIDIAKAVNRIAPLDLILKKSTLLTERIPISIAPPTGEAPRGYQFLDIFPYQLYVTATGPEETVRKLKTKGTTLLFHLSDLSRADLDSIWSKTGQEKISFVIPQAWKKVSLPGISDTLVTIDDPQASFLRIDFLRQELIALEVPIPVSIFFPAKYSNTLNPETYSLATNDLIVKKNGIKTISLPLYAQGVDRLFVDTVKEMLQIMIIAAPKNEQEKLSWNAHFAFPRELENRYVARILAEARNEGETLSPRLYENYLRNRFRNYMTRFRLYTQKEKKLSLNIELQANTISVTNRE